ncbi:MAG: hypothetical protein E7481_00880 [Ruminococcaceae bacterium]|nr:hypothetical protein [Oscillospiraceae bacterium]
MTKNILVVDEQGNEYGATYPKRAKGLVKNGRARFIDENTICIACPPKEFLEDNKMTDNMYIETTENKNELTLREVFNQIVLLQKQLTENSNFSLHRMGDSLESIFANTNVEGDSYIYECVNSVTAVFCEREETLNKLLSFYEKLYDDLKNNQ